MIHHLPDGGLPDVDHRQSLQMPGQNFLRERALLQLKRKVRGHPYPPLGWCLCLFLCPLPSGVPEACSVVPLGVCGWAAANSPRSVGSPCLEAGGNCSAGHGAPSCCSEFRAALSFSINSTSPSSPLTSMVGEAGGFVFTGALWLGGGAYLRVAAQLPAPAHPMGARPSHAYGLP